MTVARLVQRLLGWRRVANNILQNLGDHFRRWQRNAKPGTDAHLRRAVGPLVGNRSEGEGDYAVPSADLGNRLYQGDLNVVRISEGGGYVAEFNRSPVVSHGENSLYSGERLAGCNLSPAVRPGHAGATA